MDVNQRRRLREAFIACGRGATPVARLMCEVLGGGSGAGVVGGPAGAPGPDQPSGPGRTAAPPPAVTELFRQFYRTISAEAPDVRLFLSALHHLALSGEAPHLAALFPSCGGTADLAALAQALEPEVAAGRESLLDYMLSQQVRPWLPERAALLARGARAVAAQFGGGISLVEFGGVCGLNLLLDEDPGLPPVVARRGLDPAPLHPAAPDARLLQDSFLWPDETGRLTRLRHLAQSPEAQALDLRQGDPVTHLLPLLAEAYAAMAPGNTLVVMDAFAWPALADHERQQVTWQIQHLAAHLQPHKPLAWLQLEPNALGTAVDLRLHTFGWSDPEDRAVRRLAETNWDATQTTWLDA
ncbi:MAG: hypothetical protein K0R39_5027 [Symbiobacteriaceae bacterium]|nr:hypothetical protein [Symbiobacteriaceae bacterium]